MALKPEHKIDLNPETQDGFAYSTKRLRKLSTKTAIAMNLPKQRRQRGVKLTLQGWKKLQAAKAEVEDRENFGNRYTYEDLSDRSNLSVDTINKIFSHSSGVDRQSLICLFSTFNLMLERHDYSLASQIKDVESDDLELEFSGGQAPVDSPYYVERPLIKSACEPKSLGESTTRSQPEQKTTNSEEISPFSNSFNISNSTIKNLSGSGTINYHESPEVSQNRAFARVRGRVVKVGHRQISDDLRTIQTAQTNGI